jgi:putative peptidoglycan lipid II flippase
MKEKNIKTVKSAAVLGGSTFVSRVLGLVREQVRAMVLGTSMGSDAFGIAFMIPNLLRKLVGEGGISSAFVPVFTDVMHHRSETQIWEFTRRFFYFMSFILVLMVLIFVAFTPFFIKNVFAPGFAEEAQKFWLTVSLSRIMFVYIFFVGLAALAQAILNCHEKFFIPSLSPIALNLVVIASALFLRHYFSNPAYAFAVGVVAGGILQLAIQIPSLKKLGLKFKPTFTFRDPEIGRIVRLLVPTLFGVAIYEINIIVSQLIASFLEPGTVSSLQYSSRLLELTLGIFVVSIATVILPRMAKEAASGNLWEMAATFKHSLAIVNFITLPATLGLIMLRKDIVITLFAYGAFDETSIRLTAWALLFHALGLVFIAGCRVTVPAFYSLKDTKTPVVISCISMIINVLGCLILPTYLGNGGIALSNSLSIAAMFFLLLFKLNGLQLKIDWVEMMQKNKMVLVPLILMGVSVALLKNFLAIDTNDPLFHRVWQLTLMVGVPVVVYFLSAVWFKVTALTQILALIKTKWKK